MNEDTLTRRMQLEIEAVVRRQADLERQISNQSYAIKLVEHIVFAMIGLIALSVLGALITLVLR